MAGTLKKRGLDRDTVALDRALSGIRQIETTVGTLSSSVGSIKSFDYEVVTVVHAAGGGLEATAVSGTEAIISSCGNLSRISDWQITGGNLEVTASDAVTTRFLVF